MSSYFDFFCKNVGQKEETKPDNVSGICFSMCPEEEIKLRETEKLVHVLEVVGTERKMVKCYSRSAADSNMVKPRSLRPFNVLKETVQYLLLDVLKRMDVPTTVMYDFVNDRLRAVRQDMIIQQFPSDQCTQLLEPMIRFYVYFGYKLCEVSRHDYDPVLNKKCLLECIKRYLSCSDDIDKNNCSKDDNLSDLMSHISLGTEEANKLTNNRMLVESLYILCNLDDQRPIIRYLSLPKAIQRSPTLQLAFKIAVANINGLYVQICRLMSNLCPLTYCALCLYLPVLQRQAVQVLSCGYNRLSVPASAVREWLGFDSDAHAVAACIHYGMTAQVEKIIFVKGAFKNDAPMLQPKKQFLFTTENIFTYRMPKE